MNREKQIEEASVEYQIQNNPMAIGGGAFSDMIYKMNINPSFIAGAKWSDKNQHWRDVNEELPVIEDGEDGEEPFLGLFWVDDQELLYDDDDTKYDENGLVLDIVYYYGDKNWKNNRWEKVFVKYWLPIPDIHNKIIIKMKQI